MLKFMSVSPDLQVTILCSNNSSDHALKSSQFDGDNYSFYIYIFFVKCG